MTAGLFGAWGDVQQQMNAQEAQLSAIRALRGQTTQTTLITEAERAAWLRAQEIMKQMDREPTDILKNPKRDRGEQIGFQRTEKPKGRAMVRDYMNRHKDILFTLVAALLVDHFVLGGALRTRIQRVIEAALGRIEKALGLPPGVTDGKP